VIDDKRKGKTIHASRPEKEPDPVHDLMAALDRTLERLRNGEDLRAEEPESDDEEGARPSRGAKKPESAKYGRAESAR
jgi:non-homologous end joining protein Ku